MTIISNLKMENYARAFDTSKEDIFYVALM